MIFASFLVFVLVHGGAVRLPIFFEIYPMSCDSEASVFSQMKRIA